MTRPRGNSWRPWQVVSQISIALVLVLAACGNGEMSLNEYVEAFEDIADDAGEQFETLFASPQGRVLAATGEALLAHEPSELHVALDELGHIERRALAAAAEMNPPVALEELHDLFFDDTFTVARENLAARAASATTWEELSATPEMEAYRSAVERDRDVCFDIQEILDGVNVAEAFQDTPWVPGDLKEVIDAVLGCSDWNDDPSDLFRPPGETG